MKMTIFYFNVIVFFIIVINIDFFCPLLTKRNLLSSFSLVLYEHENKLISIFVALFASPTPTNPSILMKRLHIIASHISVIALRHLCASH